jgi:hypothetical protein
MTGTEEKGYRHKEVIATESRIRECLAGMEDG